MKRPYLAELHDKVHEAAGGAVSLLGRTHGGLQQVLDGDLILQGLVQQPLPPRQPAVSEDLNLQRMGMHSTSQTFEHTSPLSAFSD